MMKIRFLLFLLLSINLSIHAQNLNWVKTFGSDSTNWGNAISTDAAGNIYTTGNFSHTVDFSGGYGTGIRTANGLSDIYICKHDAAGHFIWVKTIGGHGGETGLSIKNDAAGNIYVSGTYICFLYNSTAGYYIDSVDFDPDPNISRWLTTPQTYTGNTFFLKMDAAGTVKWAGSVNTSFTSGITVDSAGNIFTAAILGESDDLDPGSGTYYADPTRMSSRYNCYVMKLNTNGNLTWAKPFTAIGNSTAAFGPDAIALDRRGNVISSGRYAGLIDFDPGPGVSSLYASHPLTGGQDMYLSKLDANGNFVWVKPLTGDGGQQEDINSIATDAKGNIYHTGFFSKTIDFDPGTDSFKLTCAGGYDMFISKLDSSGTFGWAKRIGGSLYDVGSGMVLNDSGFLYLTGGFGDVVDFDPNAGVYNIAATGYQQQFIMKMTTNGDMIWAKTTEGSNTHSYGNGIVADHAGGVFTTGLFMNSVDFDPNAGTHIITPAVQSWDQIFVMKLGPGGEPTAITTPKLSMTLSPNPTSGIVKLATGSPLNHATMQLTDVMGKTITFEQEMSGSLWTIDLAQQPSGMYFLTIKQGALEMSRKINKL